ncbi:hypothetical protein EYZ11_011119 [Aspergillus tanneri]|uniref:Uncharacterized protein n=1 Tax=Aspergillus tanneri TaxID=1220188 RepID=A0A4S3J3L6_9EURO|nr:hypothetical protein EYZ11_011119 [Aspergillus tanneri]
MPPSTVFSYWRRDHRRSGASPVSSSVQPASTLRRVSNPPQLPVIPNTEALPTTFDGPTSASTDGSSPRPWGNSPADCDADKANVVSTTSINVPSFSSTNLAVPSSSVDSPIRPHSSPEERDRDPSLTSQPNSSQPSPVAPRPDHANGDSKPSSPFRLSFGKGLLPHTQSSESQSKRLSTPGIVHAGPFRLKTSPDDSPAEKTAASQREYRYENVQNRRPGDRDASADHAHHKSGKTRLHLLNPMALLARRRSSQMASLRAEDVNIGARNLVLAIPDDYDPRIRGNIVHDFSAPRPRRNLSAAPSRQDATNRNSSDQPPPANGSHGLSNDPTARTNEQGKRHSDYSPVFKEHFEDNQRVLQIENKAYLQSSLLTNPIPPDHDSQSVPVFARKLPSAVPEQGEQSGEALAHLGPERGLNGHPPGTSSDADTIEFVPHQPLGLPKHLKSNASRFSFDMNGVESSTQEKLLEEKHKEKEAARKAQARLQGTEFSDAEDDFDNDILDDMDGLEEKIPGVNVDADEDDEFSSFSGPGDILNTSWMAPALSPASPACPTAPRMVTTAPQQGNRVPGPEPIINGDSSAGHQVSIDGAPIPPPQTRPSGELPPLPKHPQASVSQLMDDEDDLYFDDGEFGDLSAEVEGEKFDESIFDDETSHLYDRKRTSAPAAPIQPNGKSEKDGVKDADDDLSTDTGYSGGLKHVPSMASEYQAGSRKYGQVPEGLASLGSAKSHGGVLSEHNLEALHNALAKAAHQTAPEDQFERRISVDDQTVSQSSDKGDMCQAANAPSELVSDDSYLNQPVEAVSFEGGFEDFDFDDNDAALYDDPIIAAANAEALENDDEGFYGDEFGFYAQDHGNGSSELVNGGYFGPRGVEGVSRNFSGRGKFREPSLTPITERSERGSTRNSVISVTTHGAAHSNPLANPGLAQLVDVGNLEDEISLTALMKLRRGAWGGISRLYRMETYKGF